jgi:protein-disulfide isomerase
MPVRIAKIALAAAALATLLLVACSSSKSSSKLNLDGVPQNGLTLGSGGLQIKLYENFNCETCLTFAQDVMPKLVNDYVKPGKVQITFVQTPLGTTPETIYAHEASQCAADQGKFWQYYDVMYKHWKGSIFTKDELKSRATEIGLNRSTFDPCLDTDKYQADVQAGAQQFQALATKHLELPAVETEDIILAGSTNYADLKYLLDHELQ